MLSCQQEANYAEKLEKELAALRNEIDRLTACLKKANSQTEHFEREWYLRGDEVERLQAALQHEKDVAEAYKAEADEIERLREHIATQKAYYDSVFEDGARRIAKLTEQRDMAVEALRSVVFGSGDWFNLMPATLHDSLCDYLDTIQSSEVKK
jgi:predicted RNase H-like nuclease (RuvC/YqgF family)